MDRLSKIDKLEAILSAATLLPTDPVSKKGDWCDDQELTMVLFQTYTSNQDAIIPNYNSLDVARERRLVRRKFPITNCLLINQSLQLQERLSLQLPQWLRRGSRQQWTDPEGAAEEQDELQQGRGFADAQYWGHCNYQDLL